MQSFDWERKSGILPESPDPGKVNFTIQMLDGRGRKAVARSLLIVA
jgi:hypothetical protein